MDVRRARVPPGQRPVITGIATDAPPLNARDTAALHALQTLCGPDGWVRARARGQLLEASGLSSWTTWRRAAASLAGAGHVVVGPVVTGWTGKPPAYFVRSRAAVARLGTTSGTTSAPLLDTPEGSLLNELDPKSIPPEGCHSGTSGTTSRHDCNDSGAGDLASAIRYLADKIEAGLTRLAPVHAPSKPSKAPKAEPAPALAAPSPQGALFEGVPAEPEKPIPVDIPALATNIMKAWRPPKDQIKGTPGIEPSGQQRVSSRPEIEKALASALSKADDPRAEAHAILAGVKAYAAVKRTPEERTRVPAEVPWINQRRWTIPIVMENAPKQRLERGELTDAPTHHWNYERQAKERAEADKAHAAELAREKRAERVKRGLPPEETPEEVEARREFVRQKKAEHAAREAAREAERKAAPAPTAPATPEVRGALSEAEAEQKRVDNARRLAALMNAKGGGS